MRVVPILTALTVAAGLYLFVMERDSVMTVAGSSAPAAEADALEPVTAAPEATGAVSVVVMASQARAIDGVVVLRGRTEAARAVEARAETSGRVVSEPLRKGAFVETGDLLCRLDVGTRSQQLAEAEARLAEARINENAASRLSQGGYASQTRVASSEAAVESALAAIESARSGLESVEAGVQSAEAGVAAARTELDRLEIRAPFAGLLESDTAELGALLQPGALCATVIQLDPIKLVGFVPETEVDRVAIGTGARARLATGREVEGRVTFISRAADPETRTFRAEIAAPNPDLAIRDGQTAEIAVVAESRSAHLLPSSALTLDDEGALGVRLDEGGQARFYPVEILRDAPDGVFVAGLPEAARVIVVGQEYVTDGVPLDVTLREDRP